jgi:hypothetical protein
LVHAGTIQMAASMHAAYAGSSRMRRLNKNHATTSPLLVFALLTRFSKMVAIRKPERTKKLRTGG